MARSEAYTEDQIRDAIKDFSAGQRAGYGRSAAAASEWVNAYRGMLWEAVRCCRDFPAFNTRIADEAESLLREFESGRPVGKDDVDSSLLSVLTFYADLLR